MSGFFDRFLLPSTSIPTASDRRRIHQLTIINRQLEENLFDIKQKHEEEAFKLRLELDNQNEQMHRMLNEFNAEMEEMKAKLEKERAANEKLWRKLKDEKEKRKKWTFNFWKRSLEMPVCKICQEEYGEEELRVPRILECGHTLCTECSGRIRENEAIVCPWDRKISNIFNGELTKNYSVLQMNWEKKNEEDNEWLRPSPTTMTLFLSISISIALFSSLMFNWSVIGF
ncbi:unnamed protein product [Caenorhabditis sp. 36 PRJEB53466]|nr:unnamed protein product [Caenorhabditis sp. 36 PRJEB53466]